MKSTLIWRNSQVASIRTRTTTISKQNNVPISVTSSYDEFCPELARYLLQPFMRNSSKAGLSNERGMNQKAAIVHIMIQKIECKARFVYVCVKNNPN